MFIVAERMRPWIEKRMGNDITAADSGEANVDISEPEPLPLTALKRHTIVVGYGQIGKRVAASLQEKHMPYLVIEDSPKIYFRLKEIGIEAIAGNASDAEIWKAADPEEAINLVIAIPNAFEAGRATSLARVANRICALLCVPVRQLKHNICTILVQTQSFLAKQKSLGPWRELL